MEICKYEHAKFLIGRYDQLYDVVNSKANFYITINTFLAGALGAGYAAWAHKAVLPGWFVCLLAAAILLSLFSIIYTLLAIHPFTKGNIDGQDCGSLIFFGTVAGLKLPSFLEKYNSQSEEDIAADAYAQAHCLATGLTLKFARLQSVSRMAIACFILVGILTFYSIINHII